MKFSGVIFTAFMACWCYSQDYSSNWYLVQSIDTNTLSEYDKELLDSALTMYHESETERDKLIPLVMLSSNLMDEIRNDYTKLLGVALQDRPKDSLYTWAFAEYCNDMGNYFIDIGQVEESLDYHMLSLKARQELGDQDGIANSLNNIGYVYVMQDDREAALEYYLQGLEIYKIVDDKPGLGMALHNIAMVYKTEGDYITAMEYYEKSLEVRMQANDQWGIAYSLANMSVLYRDMGDMQECIRLANEALTIRREIGSMDGVVHSLGSLGKTYFLAGDMISAKNYLLECLEMATELQLITSVFRSSSLLAEIYKMEKNWGKALEMYELSISTQDSIINEENTKAAIRTQFQYEYDKQSLADSLAFAQQQELDALNHQSELDKEAQQRYALYGGLGFLLVLGGMAFRGYQRKKKDNTLITEQKKEVELQKHLVEEKNTEILDSITYAKRIQEAILPPTRLVKEWLPNSFVLYKPKDIVAGDFYWMEAVDGHSIGQQNADNTIIFAAADCTGHGVPGAMVSVVCHNAMNRAVREFGLTQPGAILDKTRELVIEQFEKSDEDVKDGMDIALCSLTGTTLHYAGAHNPLWIVRDCQAEPVEALNNPNVSVFRQAQDDTQCIIEIKATKQPIGKIDNPQPFTNHTIELQPNDAFYIFSDGFVDQFGGQKGKKFKAKAFRELLLSIQDRNMEEQRMLINEEFEQWRGELEQVDDVCVIGVKI